jgi:bile acid:Na+ symporter, BASS family
MDRQIVDILVSAVLGLVMFGVGLSLRGSDFKRVFRYPKELVVALTSQMVALPIIAFVLATLHPGMDPALKTGFIILAASPGGATSGFITYLFRGNVALSIALTTINSLLTLFTIPLIVNLALSHFMGLHTEMKLPFWETVQHIFAITIIPAGLGLLVGRNQPQLASVLQRPARYVMLLLLFAVFMIKIFAGESQGGTSLSLAEIKAVLPHGLVQNICCLFIGYFVMRSIGAHHPSRLTAAIESGVQNTTLSFLIAGTMIGNEQMVIPPLVYAMFSFTTACIFAYAANRMNGNKKMFKF